MFSGKSIKTKLLAAFGVVILLLVAIGVVGIYGLKQVTSPYEHIMTVNFPNTYHLGQIQAAEKDAVIQASVLLGSTATLQQVNDALAVLKGIEDRFAKDKKAYEDSEWAPGEEEQWKVTDKAWGSLMEMTKHLVELSRSGSKEDNAIRDKLGETKYKDLIKQFEEPFKELLVLQDNDSKKWSKSSVDTHTSIQWFSMVTTLAGVVLGLILALFMARSLSSTLSTISNQLAAGAGETSAAVEQLSAAATELSAGATEQSASLQETSSAVEEISSMVSKTSESARKSAEATEESRTQATRGQQVVAEMVQSMSNINDSNQTIITEITASNEKIGAIVGVIQEIATKTKVINDIVFQTKLLSFNASVEAARAGEHGKGFAVVAEEVGNLASMSGNAAQEISGMLDESVKKVETIVQETKTKVEKLMTDSKATVDQGSQVATECGKVLDEIVKSAMSSSQLVQEISKASEEQSHGIAEIAKAVQQLNEVTHSNASAANQTATTSEQLATQAHSLNGMATQLQAFVEGGSGAHLQGQYHSNAPRNTTAPVKKSNVIALKRDQSRATGNTLKKAAGAENQPYVPSDNDPRFSDV